MFNVGGAELLVIMLVALLVLGPQRLPDAARQVGKVMAEVRKVSSGFQRELKDALDADPDADPRPRRTEATPLAASVAEADAAAASTDAASTDQPSGAESADSDVTPAEGAAETDVRRGRSDDAPVEIAPVEVAPADVAPAEGPTAAETPAVETPAVEVAPVEPVGPAVAPAVAEALDEIAAPLDDQRAAS